MRTFVVVIGVVLALGCAAEQPPAPEPPPAPDFIHRVDWRGQTLEQIAGWYTGAKPNWQKLVKPVNPDLERCCVPLRVGREVVIPRSLVVTVEPMPQPKPAPRPKPVAAAPQSAAKKPVAAAAPAPAAAEAPARENASAETTEPAPESPKAAPVAAASDSTMGKVTLKGETWGVADAIAYPGDEEGEVEVALVSKAFDRKEIAKDGKVDGFDVMRGEGSSLTVPIGADGSASCLNFMSGNGGGSLCNSAIAAGFQLASRSAERIAGSLSFTDGEDKVDVRFDLPILTQVERAGEPLPSGGGEPGAAVLANLAAIQSGDFDAVMALAEPEQRKMMEENVEESREMLGLMQAMTPSDVKIHGGVLDGDEATLDFEGSSDGQPVKGTIGARRVGGKWYMGPISVTH